MIKEIFRNKKLEDNTKEMYSKLAMLTNTRRMTDMLNPGESFIISNNEAIQV